MASRLVATNSLDLENPVRGLGWKL